MQRSKSQKIILPIIFVIFALYAFSLIFPFLWLTMNALKTQNDFTLGIFSLPKVWHFSNLVEACLFQYKNYNVMLMMINSVFITLVTVILQLFFYSVTAYIVAKYKFFGKNFIYSLVIVLMVMPAVSNVAATYRILKFLNLFNSHLGLFVLTVSGFSGMGFLMMYSFYKNISWAYAEAAFIDGANDMYIYFKIMLPQALPILFSLAILQILAVWNDFFTPYMFLPGYPTLAVGLNELNTNIRYIGNYPLLFSVMLISIIPILLLFIAFQRTIMDNTIAGGIKG